MGQPLVSMGLWFSEACSAPAAGVSLGRGPRRGKPRLYRGLFAGDGSGEKQIILALKFAAQAAQLVWRFHWNSHGVAKQCVERFDPEHLAREDCAEVSRYGLRHFVQ